MGGLFSTDVPAAPEPVTIVDIDDEAIKRARSRELAQQQARTGRASTRLTQPQTAPGREYTRTTLG